MDRVISFASDNFAGVHPEILEAIAGANLGHVKAYGDDPYTARVVSLFKQHLGEKISVYPVFNGTAANVLALKALVRSHQAVICAATAHIHLDECGAPESYLGSKLIPVPTPDGKLRPEMIAPLLGDLGNQHRVQPRVISISQCTELGTVYTVDEVRALADFAHAHGLYLHLDGARISNAAAFLGVSLRELTADAGVDAMSFGGTKNGALLGEAVVFFREGLGEEFRFLRKQGMQLGSKMRFISAQFEALLGGDLWLRSARHSNAMATRLAERVRGIAGVEIVYPVETNAVFAAIPTEAIPPLQERFFFHVWDRSRSVVRWMTAFDTTEADVDAFAAAIKRSVAEKTSP